MQKIGRFLFEKLVKKCHELNNFFVHPILNLRILILLERLFFNIVSWRKIPDFRKGKDKEITKFAVAGSGIRTHEHRVSRVEL